MRKQIYVFLIVLMLLTLGTLIGTSSVAHADGGAPNLAYVVGASGGVAVIDVQQQKVVKTIQVTGDPHLVALSADGRFLYVTQPQLHRLSIIAAKTGDSVCSADIPGTPDLVLLDPNVNLLYVGGSQSPTVTVVDATNCTIKRQIETAGPVYGLSYAIVGLTTPGKTGEQLWVSNEKVISIYDDVNGNALGSVSVPQGPRYLSSPPGSTVYATTAQHSVVAINIATPHTVMPLISGGSYGPMDFDETTGVVYVPDATSHQLIALTPVSAGSSIPKEPNHEIPLDTVPRSVAITSDGQLAFIALSSGDASMYDIPGHQFVTKIHTGGSPQFIITGLYPPSLGTTPTQASFWNNFALIAGYIIVIALLIVPFILFRRYSRTRKIAQANEENPS
ncbi:YncE family protein [Dictyobacter arantiisoli]|uniref:YncE family protein n=1 Tax=Dictyobacter arantiisoli TaxID=2014874 RepID=A0A5A5T5X6_9CHLR|nr:YncE family protein [Dictyobacter arantiisoli]GCF06596.1 hypothetical protein KDI_01600 [Dictyobacter arantiisoli]